MLALLGVDDSGHKHLIALEGGVRESTQSLREVLLGAKAKGLNATKLAMGEGVLCFWAALDEVFPTTKHQRCWMHKSGNVMNYLPESVRMMAEHDLHQIWIAERRAQVAEAMALFGQK